MTLLPIKPQINIPRTHHHRTIQLSNIQIKLSNKFRKLNVLCFWTIELNILCLIILFNSKPTLSLNTTIRKLQLRKVFRMVFNIWLTLIYGLKKGGERDHIYVLSLSVVHILWGSICSTVRTGVYWNQKLLEVSVSLYLYWVKISYQLVLPIVWTWTKSPSHALVSSTVKWG